MEKLVKVLKSAEAFKILDDSKAPDTTFQYGGCWILADALSEYLGVPVYVVYSKTRKRVEHFIVKVNSMYFDSDGIQSEKEMIQKIANDSFCDCNGLRVKPFDTSLNTSSIVKDSETSKKLIKIFK